ncbi:MAG: glycosyltransferase family 2 protein, partial [Bacteroidia bacterium]
WCFYIQSDEALHEKYHELVLESMRKYKDDKSVDGLLFDYLHFYGGYNYVGNSRRWYRKEIRIIRNDKNIRSYKDAQGFRKRDDTKLNVKAIEAAIYHYGWVKPPKAQQAKQENFHKMWHDDEWMKKNIAAVEEFDYSDIDTLELFNDTHPKPMLGRVAGQSWVFHYDPSKLKLSLKDKLLRMIENSSGWRPGEYKNYNLLK